nr:MAG TPA: hypothetical protein [Caudoviricetes sp.]
MVISIKLRFFVYYLLFDVAKIEIISNQFLILIEFISNLTFIK